MIRLNCKAFHNDCDNKGSCYFNNVIVKALL